MHPDCGPALNEVKLAVFFALFEFREDGIGLTSNTEFEKGVIVRTSFLLLSVMWRWNAASEKCPKVGLCDSKLVLKSTRCPGKNASRLFAAFMPIISKNTLAGENA